MKDLTGKTLPFFIVLILYQALMLILILISGYRDSFLLLNGGFPAWLDLPMFLLTHLGDGLILTSLLALLFVRKYPSMVLLLVVVVVVTGFSGQILKNFVFDEWARPLGTFGPGKVHTIYGYNLYQNSFPSGHSITVAAAFTLLVLVLKPAAPLLILSALLTALISYSRVYVGAHFPGDVLAGTVLGSGGSLLLTWWLNPWISRGIAKLTAGKLAWITGLLTFSALTGLVAGVLMLREFLVRIF
jgi:undecaprenyl-diphosphatase